MSDEAKWWARVEKSGRTECWPWKGPRHPRGYGIFYSSTGRYYAHRWLMIQIHGPLTPDQHAIHSCDNPPCCNPAHLSVGTRSDNMSDAVSKFRFGNQKVTDELRDEILRRSRDGESSSVIARSVGLSAGHVRKVVSRSCPARRGAP